MSLSSILFISEDIYNYTNFPYVLVCLLYAAKKEHPRWTMQQTIEFREAVASRNLWMQMREREGIMIAYHKIEVALEQQNVSFTASFLI